MFLRNSHFVLQRGNGVHFDYIIFSGNTVYEVFQDFMMLRICLSVKAYFLERDSIDAPDWYSSMILSFLADLISCSILGRYMVHPPKFLIRRYIESVGRNTLNSRMLCRLQFSIADFMSLSALSMLILVCLI